MGNSLVSEREGGSSTQVGLWAEAESLAADFDGSLSGLGGDLSTASYDMSEALLALPSLYQQRINVTNNPVYEKFFVLANRNCIPIFLSLF